MIITYNGKTTLGRLSAYDKYLWAGEKIVILRFIICVIVPVVLSILRIWLYVFGFYNNFLAIYCAWACILWKVMELRIASNRKTAAKILQLAECDLFGLRWNKFLCGEALLPEDVVFNRRHDIEHYKGFFPEKLEGLSQNEAYLEYVKYRMGQFRTNSSKQLRLCLWVAGILFITIVLTVILVPGLSMNGFLFFTIVTCAPLVVWVSSLFENVKRGDKQLNVVQAIINDSASKEFPNKWKELIQDYIFMYREQGFLTPRIFLS